jgi:hypothetical protein
MSDYDLASLSEPPVPEVLAGMTNTSNSSSQGFQLSGTVVGGFLFDLPQPEQLWALQDNLAQESGVLAVTGRRLVCFAAPSLHSLCASLTSHVPLLTYRNIHITAMFDCL